MVCRVDHKESGRALECFSNQPGVQFYTGNFIPTDDSLTGKNGCFYKKHAGFVKIYFLLSLSLTNLSHSLSLRFEAQLGIALDGN